MKGRCENAVKNRWNSASFRERRARNEAATLLLPESVCAVAPTTSKGNSSKTDSFEVGIGAPRKIYNEGDLVWIKEGSRDDWSWWPSVVFSSWAEVKNFGLPTVGPVLSDPPKGGCIAFFCGPGVSFGVINNASSNLCLIGDSLEAPSKMRMGKDKAYAWKLAVSEAGIYMGLSKSPTGIFTPRSLDCDFMNSRQSRPAKRSRTSAKDF